MTLKYITILLSLVSWGCAAQVKCESNQEVKKLVTVCNPENRVLCYDRERKQEYTNWCRLGHLQVTAQKIFVDNFSVLVCDEVSRNWKFIIPFDQVCEIYQETVCKAK